MKKNRVLVLPLAMLLTLTSCNGKAFIQKGFDMFDAEYQELLGEKLTYHVINYLVVNDEQSLSDLFLGEFGYYSQEEFFNIIYESLDDPNYNPSLDKDSFSYEELLNKTFYYYPNDLQIKLFSHFPSKIFS